MLQCTERHMIQLEPSYLTHHLTGLLQWLQKQISGSGGTTLLRFCFQFYNINSSLLNNLKFWQWVKTFLPCLRNTYKQRQTLNGEIFSLVLINVVNCKQALKMEGVRQSWAGFLVVTGISPASDITQVSLQ